MFQIEKKHPASRARVGVLKTAHGSIKTPAYVIVGTHASVRALEPNDLPATKTQIIIANTYHLWKKYGDEGLKKFPGLHALMGWPGPIMTDSGGFQVFSLGFLRTYEARRYPDVNFSGDPRGKSLVRINTEGVYFEDPTEMYLDAEKSIEIQEKLGGDIIVAFDEATAPALSYEYTKTAMERTHLWAARSLGAKKSTTQLLYGVVQGGGYRDLRCESSRVIGEMGFDGFAIGSTYGKAYGGTKEGTHEMIDWALSFLPEEKPRHLFGVGQVDDIFDGVAQGIDTFDCVIPTREARHGSCWTHGPRIDITSGRYRNDDAVIDGHCGCPVCSDKTSRKYLHTLFKEKNPEAGRLATIHNVYFFNRLMEDIREGIVSNTLERVRSTYMLPG